MDREEIERRDFPVGRRGYDQGTVDAHLRRVADEHERVREQAEAPARATLSAGTSEQVRLILEAAERSAADLRTDAGREAGDHVERVGEATEGMLRRIDELQSELGTLMDSLRESGERLADGLGELHERVADVHPPVAPLAAEDAPPSAAGPGEDAPPPVAAAPEEDAPPRLAAAPETRAAEVVPPPVQDEDFAAAAEPDAHADDEAAARITALNMALSGTPREETAAYVAEHYRLTDVDALLDDVYAKAGR